MEIEPITREEQLLNAVASGTSLNLEPITREEMFLAKAAGMTDSAPEPITRKEMFLSKISGGGSGGGSAGVGVTYTKEKVQYESGLVRFGSFSNEQDFESRFKGAVLSATRSGSFVFLAMYPTGGGEVVTYYIDAFADEYSRQEAIVIESGKINWRFDPDGFFAPVADETNIYVRYFTQ